jgi:uncharacterized RDD family membrane protein YckC
MTEPGTPETPPGQPASAWQAPPAATPVPGTAGFVYADVPNRVIALIIDGIILAIITFIVTAVLYGIVGAPVTLNLEPGILTTEVNYVSTLLGAILSLAIGAAYWIYSWTAMRASPGQKMLGMQVGNSPDGATLTQEQAIRRWAVLFAPFSLSQVVYVLPTLGALLGLATFIYAIYLLYTTAQSPTKQGFHDKFANTVVVKASRSV